MKTKLFIFSLALAMGAMTSCSKKDAVQPEVSETEEANAVDVAAARSGSLSGSHYQVNIIGVPKGKTADMSNNNGARIFVPLTGNTKILLSQGEFGVLDANGTDGTAKFQLPNPDPDNDGITVYTVFSRPLGTPGGTSTTTTCATDPLTNEVVCSNASYVAVRKTGKSSWTNVSAELLYIYTDLNGDGVVERYPLFDERLKDYFWQYDNLGLKVLQLRFYETATNVN